MASLLQRFLPRAGRVAAKLLLPLIGLPALLLLLGVAVHRCGLASLLSSIALTAAAIAVLLALCLLRLAWRFEILEAQFHELALHDDLTKIHNLRGFQMLGERALRDAKRLGLPLSVLYFDLDGLKAVNDRHGHAAGSALIVEVAELLCECFEAPDLVARVGGDEFVVATFRRHADLAAALARLDLATALRNGARRQPYAIGFSMGEARNGGSSFESLAEIVARADAAMYRSKRAKLAGALTAGSGFPG